MSSLVEIILPVFLVLSAGYVVVWRGIFSDATIDGLMTFSQNFAIPLLLFRAISTLDLSQGYNSGLLISYYTGSLTVFTLGTLGAHYVFSRGWETSVAIGFSALFANTLLLGLPIMERAFGTQSLAPNFAIISIHAPFCYFLGIASMEIARAKAASPLSVIAASARAMFKNALMMAIILGFIVNLSGFVLPVAVDQAMSLIVRAALPTALFALGGILYRYRPEGSLREIAMVCSLSLIVHPAIALFMTVVVFDLPTGMVRAAVLTASMAPGVNSYIFASLYGRGQRAAASSVLVGTLLSVLSVSVWLTILGA